MKIILYTLMLGAMAYYGYIEYLDFQSLKNLDSTGDTESEEASGL